MRPQTKGAGSTDIFRVNAPQTPHYPCAGCIGGILTIRSYANFALGYLKAERNESCSTKYYRGCVH